VERGWLIGLLGATSVTTVYYIARQTANATATRKHLRNLLALFSVAPVTHEVLVAALDLGYNDFEDAVLHEAAWAAEATGIVTRNPDDFRRSRIRLYTPTELVTILQTLHP
jgi:hypothetical protein